MSFPVIIYFLTLLIELAGCKLVFADFWSVADAGQFQTPPQRETSLAAEEWPAPARRALI
jgi:hypothetical protein